MPLYSDDGYPEGTVRSIDPGYDPNKSFVRDPYEKRRPPTAQSTPSASGLDGTRKPPGHEGTASQRGHSRPASVQSGRTGSTARPPPPKRPQSRHSRINTNIRDFSAHDDDDEQSIRSYSTARKGSFPVDATRPIGREGGSVYSQDPVQPRETMSAYSGSRQAQPVYGNGPPPNDPFGLSMNMGALALDDRSHHSAAPSSRHGRSEISAAAAPSSRHGQERDLVPQNGFQDRMPPTNSTQQSLRSSRGDDYARQAYEFKQAIRDEIRPLATASDRYIDPRRAIEARGAQVIERERLTARIMGSEAYDRATYGAPEIDFSQRPAPRSGLASTSASSNYDNQYYQPQLPAPRKPGFIEAVSVGDDDDFSVGSHGTSSCHSRRESVSYNGSTPPRRAIMPGAPRSRDPRNDSFDEPPPPRTRPPPSHTGSHQSVRTRSDYPKHDSRAGRSRRSSRREERDGYDN